MGRASGLLSRVMRVSARIEPHEMRAVWLSFLYFFLIMASYYVLRPIRDAMGTVYGADRLEHLFTATFFATFLAAPIYAGVASRMKLRNFLPWVYGFFLLNILIFYALFESHPESRIVAAIFYVWLSVFNMFIISVFWSFMADLYSRAQAKRLFGFVAAGGSLGAAIGPAITTVLVKLVGTGTMLLVSAAGFGAAILVIRLLVREKERLRVAEREEAQPTRLDHRLGGNPFTGFGLLLRSPYLLLIAAFILLLTWISTIVYFQQAELIARAFESREARTQAFAVVDLIVNICAIAVQLFGTGRIVTRFGVTTGLVLNPLIMLAAFLLVALSPVLMMLLGVQIVRRVAEYAIARPSREMLFTVVDQESKYKAKNVLDTVVYRFGDLSAAWAQTGLAAIGFGVAGVALFGAAVAILWGAVAFLLGQRFERVKAVPGVGLEPTTS
ncbi:MAG TPA: MFS transporter [Sphingomonadaceae bacterium]|nr:MFS transporter [Sphingomonadaceae bacterium]